MMYPAMHSILHAMRVQAVDEGPGALVRHKLASLVRSSAGTCYERTEGTAVLVEMVSRSQA